MTKKGDDLFACTTVQYIHYIWLKHKKIKYLEVLLTADLISDDLPKTHRLWVDGTGMS